MNVQYGCGKCAPNNWINFDISPTLRLEKLPIIGKLFIRKEWGAYPKNVRIGNILNGLPGIRDNSSDAVYCSHVLEHLPYYDLQKALSNTYKILKTGGVFRLVVPDFEVYVNTYIKSKENGDKGACHTLIFSTLMAEETRDHSLSEKFARLFGNSKHLWNYDFDSMSLELDKAGFKDIRRAVFSDSTNLAFLDVEDIGRWDYSLGIECVK